MDNKPTVNLLKSKVIKPGICSGCGACVGIDSSKQSKMDNTNLGPIPNFNNMDHDLPKIIKFTCPSYQLNYPELYKDFWNLENYNPITGKVIKARTGFSSNPKTRHTSSSGGVITVVLTHLLEANKIDSIITVQQGIPRPLNAKVVILNTLDELRQCSQSVYIPVSVLDVLRDIDPKKKYAITCLPDQAAALRKLQTLGHKQALAIQYILGPYTGTAIYPAAIDSFLKSNGMQPDDTVVSLKWRAGEWPGYLEIITQSGLILKSPKVYYNYLIPFFITQNSLQNMDFVNEFCDLSVGDAWSPKHEKLKGGQSVFVTRSDQMEEIIQILIRENKLCVEDIEPMKASEMHGHMIDFKKRGAYIRNSFRNFIGLQAPKYGMKPKDIPLLRWLIEIVIIFIFYTGKTRFARWVISVIPEKVLGVFFNNLRLAWKGMSKPTKRKGLSDLQMIAIENNN